MNAKDFIRIEIAQVNLSRAVRNLRNAIADDNDVDVAVEELRWIVNILAKDLSEIESC